MNNKTDNLNPSGSKGKMVVIIIIIVIVVFIIAVLLGFWLTRPTKKSAAGPANVNNAPAGEMNTLELSNLKQMYGLDPKTDDTDGDGLSDQVEIYIYQTNPFNKDTDGDGYTDGDEVSRGYNPNGPGLLQ